jgi:predicted methyltransferase
MSGPPIFAHLETKDIMRTGYFATIVSLFVLSACGQDSEREAGTSANSGTANTSQAPARTPDDWHATDSLFKVMGGVNGKIVADLFVGDGYYTRKMLEAGARVIAMDDDPRNVEAITKWKAEAGIGDDRLLIRSATPGAPNLNLAEVDMALCTRPFISIPDRTGYFTKVKASIKPPCMLFIVDFLPEQTPEGTPMDQRVSEEQVMDAMEPVGFTDIGGYTKKLPYRFVVQAMDFVEGNLPPEVQQQMNAQPQ